MTNVMMETTERILVLTCYSQVTQKMEQTILNKLSPDEECLEDSKYWQLVREIIN